MDALGRSFSILALGLAGWGCGARGGPTARSTADGLFDAMSAGDVAALATLTGREEAETSALVDDARAEIAALAAAARTRPLESRGRAYLEAGEVVVLVQEDGRWHVASGILGVASLETPADAIRALSAMLRRIEGTGLESVLARDTRGAVHEELERWRRSTADPDALPIAIDGDTAIATTPAGGTIELRREAGEWRVVDLR